MYYCAIYFLLFKFCMKITFFNINFRLLFFVFVSVFFCNSITAQMIGTEIFLQGHWLEIGQSTNGTFGSTSVPAGYHPHGFINNLAEVYDYGHDGWTIGSPPEYGDYTFPGSPYEGWGLQVNGLYNQANYITPGTFSGTGTLTGNNVSYSNRSGRMTANWQGTASSGNLVIDQTTYIDTEASWVVINTVLKNTSAAAIPNIYYIRICDPDNDETQTGGSFSTVNSISFQNDALHRVLVSAKGTAYTNCYMGIGTKDCRAKCFSYTPFILATTTDFSTIWNQTLAGTTFTGGLPAGDNGIGLIFNVGTIAAGDSTILTYAYIFNDSTGVDSAFPEPQIVTLGLAYDATDTVKRCQVSDSTFPVSISNGIDKVWFGSQWTWSPSVGLSTTTGIYNNVNFNALAGITTYTITGTNPMMNDCTAKTFYLTVDPTQPVIIITPGSTTTFCAGDSVVLMASISAGYTYQWYMNSTIIAGATNSSYAAYVSGNYTVVVNYLFCTNSSSVTSVTVNPLPSAILGTNTICVGNTEILSDTSIGGIWSSTNLGLATIDPSLGNITTIASGTDTIVYTLPTNCSVNLPITIHPIPFVPVITGITNICTGTVTTMNNGLSGGVWSSSNNSIATINALTGFVTGISQGIVTLSYTDTNIFGCSATVTIADTVNAIPVSAPITGIINVCIGNQIMLSDSILFGTWSSADNTIATIDPFTGIVTGIAQGTVKIYYNITSICGIITDSTTITVNPLPTIAPIIGPSGSICSFSAITLTDSIPGGLWTSSNTTVATVNSINGRVNDITAGNTTITYFITDINGCSNSTTFNLTFAGNINAYLTPHSSITLCRTNHISMHVHSFSSSLAYQWQMNGTAITGATDSTFTTTIPGIFSALISNGTCSEVLPTLSVLPQPHPTITKDGTSLLFTGSFYSYQWLLNGSIIPGATTSIYIPAISGNYSIIATDINGCADTSSAYIFTNGTNNIENINYNSKNVSFYPNPATTLLHIDAPFETIVKIISPDGKNLIQEKSAKDINIEMLNIGVFIIQIYDNNGLLILTDKLVKINNR